MRIFLYQFSVQVRSPLIHPDLHSRLFLIPKKKGENNFFPFNFNFPSSTFYEFQLCFEQGILRLNLRVASAFRLFFGFSLFVEKVFGPSSEQNSQTTELMALNISIILTHYFMNVNYRNSHISGCFGSIEKCVIWTFPCSIQDSHVDAVGALRVPTSTQKKENPRKLHKFHLLSI